MSSHSSGLIFRIRTLSLSNTRDPLSVLCIATSTHSKMNSLQRAIVNNNDGVQLFNNGNIAGAMRTFQSAVILMKHAGTAFEAMCISENYDSANHDFALGGATTEQRHPPGLQSGASFVYQRPLLIPTNLKTTDHFDSVILTVTTLVIFNFALACHQSGNTTGRELFLERAERLYDLVLKVLASSESKSDHAMRNILRCLALNNLAQLHYDRCNYPTSQSYMEVLYNLIVTMDCLDHTYLTEREVKEIMMNIVHMQPPTAAYAA